MSIKHSELFICYKAATQAQYMNWIVTLFLFYFILFLGVNPDFDLGVSENWAVLGVYMVCSNLMI